MEVREGAGAYVCGEEYRPRSTASKASGGSTAKFRAAARPCRSVRPTDDHQQRAVARHRADHHGLGGEFYRDFGMGRPRGTMPIQLAEPRRAAACTRRPSALRSASWSTRTAANQKSGRPVRAVQVGGPLGAYFPAVVVRHAVRLRGLRRRRRPDRPWRKCGSSDDTVDMAQQAHFKAWSSAPSNRAASARPAGLAPPAAWRWIDKIIANDNRAG